MPVTGGVPIHFVVEPIGNQFCLMVEFLEACGFESGTDMSHGNERPMILVDQMLRFYYRVSSSTEMTVFGLGVVNMVGFEDAMQALQEMRRKVVARKETHKHVTFLPPAAELAAAEEALEQKEEFKGFSLNDPFFTAVFTSEHARLLIDMAGRAGVTVPANCGIGTGYYICCDGVLQGPSTDFDAIPDGMYQVGRDEALKILEKMREARKGNVQNDTWAPQSTDNFTDYDVTVGPVVTDFPTKAREMGRNSLADAVQAVQSALQEANGMDTRVDGDLTLEVLPGDSLDRVHEEAVRIAAKTGHRVEFVFNDVPHRVSPSAAEQRRN